MLKIHHLQEGKLVEQEPGSDIENSEGYWFELVAPTKAELTTVQAFCASPLPNIREIDELEASSHHLVFETGFQVNSLFFSRPEGEARNINASFIYCSGGLISICSRELPHFRLLHMRNRNGIKPLPDTLTILMTILDIKVDGLADEMEQAYRDLEDISHGVLGRSDVDLEEAVDGLAAQEDLIGKVRLCLMDGQRDIRFIMRQPIVTKKYRRFGQALLGDIETLLPHNDFLSEKADFLLNATQGFIDMEQNRIMKIFSVTALVFLPPTLIAAIYGMNFTHMPEIGWPWGYPLALGLMVLAGAGPYFYFRRKGWL